MILSRRELLISCAGALPVLAAAAEPATGPKRTPMGVVIHSYHLRNSAEKDRPEADRLDDPLRFLNYCAKLGAGGVQVALGFRDEAYPGKLRRQAEAQRMYVEGSIRLPRNPDDLPRFMSEIYFAVDCGVPVLRTTLMSGRRYEVFDSAEAYRRFREESERSLTLARPVAEKKGVKLAVENHKDLRSAELAELLRRIDSPHIGACIDTGNNIALLEAPQTTVETLAPFALTTHIKDMGVEEYADGFLLAEVPLGTGFLDLPKIIATLRRARSTIHFNLEMMTRDPLRVPCLTKKYWLTFADLPGRRLAESLALVRSHAAKKPLPRITGLKRDEQLKLEDDNVRRCLAYAREHLSF
jgi:sugar phosphate isomerase/epimerase